MKISNILHKFDNIDKHFIPQEFWCAVCDQVLVRSSDPTSGTWFQASGHERILKVARKDDTGNYETIIFAVCTKCYGDFKYE